MDVGRIIKSGIDENEKISLIEEHVDKLRRIILAYKLRDNDIAKELLKIVKPIEYKEI